MNIFLPIAAIGIFLIAKYGPTGVALLKLEFSFVSFGLEKIAEDNITAYLILKTTNKTGTTVLLQNITARLTLNGVDIGNIADNYAAPLQARGEDKIKVLFTINKNTVGDELWNMILNKQTDFTFSMTGSVKANDMTFPLNSVWTMRDLTQQTQVTGVGAVKKIYTMDDVIKAQQKVQTLRNELNNYRSEITEIQTVLSSIDNNEDVFFNIVQYRDKWGLVREYGKKIGNKTRWILTPKGRQILNFNSEQLYRQ